MTSFTQRLKNAVKRMPGVVFAYELIYGEFLYRLLYRRTLYRFISVKGRQRYRITQWIKQGIQFAREKQVAQITFSQNAAWVRDDAGIEWAYIPELSGGVHKIEFGREYEKAELDLVVRFLKPGNVFFDVGANIGFFSIRAARMVPGLRVYAFEPVQATFHYLVRNMQRNNLSESVRAFRLALGNQTGCCRVTTNLGPTNYVLPHINKLSTKNTELVEQITLDMFVQQEHVDRIDFIKCDVEGAELWVLQGGRATLLRYSPLLLLEIQTRWTQRYGYRPEDIFDFLCELGFSYYRVTEDGNVLPPLPCFEQELIEGHNFLFYHRDKSSLFCVRRSA